MKVLVLMKEPCPTSVKFVKALKLLGKGKITVTVISEVVSSSSIWKRLGYDIDIHRVVYPVGISLQEKMNTYFFSQSVAWRKILKELDSDAIDIVQTFTPDYLPVFARKYMNKPVAHHFREIQSIFPYYLFNKWTSSLYYPFKMSLLKKMEREAIASGDILSFDSPGSLEIIQNNIGSEKKMVVLKNAPLSTSLPCSPQAKLSAKTGKCTIAYHGHINTSSLEFIEGLCSRAIEIHMYPLVDSKSARLALTRLKKNPYFHAHDNIIGYKEFIYELSQYDYGLIPPSRESLGIKFFNTYLPCKVFDYIAAGLPVISGNYTQIKEYLEQNRVGFIVESVDDVLNIVEKHYNVRLIPVTVDEDVAHIIGLYKSMSSSLMLK